MARFVGYEQCPRCAANGRDSRSDNMGVYSDNSKHCYACGYHIFPKHYVKETNEEKLPENKAKLPHDYTGDVPAEALKWLLQYGLPYSYWKENIGYSEAEGRLVFRIGDCTLKQGKLVKTSEPLAFSIGRLVKQQEIGKKPRKWYVWGDAHKHTHVLGEDNDGPVILVEDWISANKLASSGLCCSLPLFGTSICSSSFYYLLHSKRDVVLWLDQDQEMNTRRQALRLSLLLNKQVKVVVTERDPKLLTHKEIKEQLNENF